MVLSDITISQMDNTSTNSTTHLLSVKWSLWCYIPKLGSEWNINLCHKICTFTSVEECVAIIENLPEDIIKKCMMFIMRENVVPQWEHPSNRHGGYFSFKASNKNVCRIWKDLTYTLIGNSLSPNVAFARDISGITISPKKNFCIIKVWMSSCEHQNYKVMNKIEGLDGYGCFFAPHNKNASFKNEDEC